jgi:hypothetical protein
VGAVALLVRVLPWFTYIAFVSIAWWLILFDGRASTDALGYALLAPALAALFIAVRVSRWHRRWLRARLDAEASTHRPAGGGSLLDWLLPW